MSPFGPSFPPQPRVYFRNQPFLPSRAPRSANISPVLSTVRILPVATGLPTMVGVYPSSAPLKTSGRIHGESRPRRKPRRIIPLRTLFYPDPRRVLSLRSFPRSHRLFSITCGLFSQNTGGGIPLRDLVRCTEARKCLFVSPLLVSLTHSVSRKSFACHSYANTRDGGVTPPPKFFSPLVYPERLLRRATRHSPLALTTFRINTCKSVSRQTTLTSFRINTYEKTGEGRGSSV